MSTLRKSIQPKWKSKAVYKKEKLLCHRTRYMHSNMDTYLPNYDNLCLDDVDFPYIPLQVFYLLITFIYELSKKDESCLLTNPKNMNQYRQTIIHRVDPKLTFICK